MTHITGVLAHRCEEEEWLRTLSQGISHVMGLKSYRCENTLMTCLYSTACFRE